MEKYPKVLIINDESIYKENATGITLRSLFKLWPSSNVREFHLWKATKIEREGLKINASEIPQKTFPINCFLRKLTGASISEESGGIGFGSGVSIHDVNMKSAKLGIKEYVKWTSETWFINIKYIISILKQEKFVPDIIYTFGGRFGVHNVVYKLSKYYKCPVCVHYMDNWRETLFSNTPNCFNLNRKINISIERIEKLGKYSLVISPLMEKKYKELYHGNYKVLMNSIDIADSKDSEIEFDHNKIKFVYAGGLHLNRYQALLDIQAAIAKSSIDPNLLIYTSDDNRRKYQALFNPKVTIFREFLPHDRVNEIYSEADVLVHMESFDKVKQLYTKYSLSTKIPEYMFSGKPILCYASRELAVSQYITRCKAGLCCDNKTELDAAVKKLTLDSNLRTILGKMGKEIAIANHNISKARELLLFVFENNIKNNTWEKIK